MMKRDIHSIIDKPYIYIFSLEINKCIHEESMYVLIYNKPYGREKEVGRGGNSCFK